MTRLLLAIALAACLMAIAPPGRTAAPAGLPDRVESLRKHALSRERYVELEKEWKRYTVSHPREAVGWTQLARAANYSGKPCREAIGYAEKAVQLAPNDAEALATLGGWKWVLWCDGQPADPAEAIGLLERSLKLDPDLDDPHIRLWVMRLSKGQREAAANELRSLIDRGRIPEPLLDYGYNHLVGLEPNAILLTNGDNDTYPLIALQVGRGVRPDVTVVNLSMLNLGWYRRELREGRTAVPVPLMDQSPDSNSMSAEAEQGLIENLAKAGWKRPLYMACTVDCQGHPMPNQLSLEGLVYRVLPKAGTGMEADTTLLSRNLEERYRLESATSPGLDWKAWSSVSQLMLNYAAAELQLGSARARAGDRTGARRAMSGAVALSEFHHSPYLGDVVKMWSAWDAGGAELARWKKKLGM